MKKIVLLIGMLLLLVACSPKEVELGMSQDEVQEIIGEPDLIMNGYAAEIMVELSLDNHWSANKDDTHRLNTDEAFKTEVSHVIGKLNHLEDQMKSGGYVELHNYETEDDGDIHYFFLNDELFLIDDVARYMIPQLGK